MSLTESNMLPIMTEAPHFNLPDVLTNEHVSFSEVQGE